MKQVKAEILVEENVYTTLEEKARKMTEVSAASYKKLGIPEHKVSVDAVIGLAVDYYYAHRLKVQIAPDALAYTE